MADTIIGGRVTVKANGVDIEVMGDVSIENPYGSTREAKATDSGNLAVTIEAAPTVFKIGIIDRKGSSLEELWNADSLNVTVKEDDVEIYHLLTGGMLTGNLTKNLKSGEIDGFEISGGAGSYRREDR